MPLMKNHSDLVRKRFLKAMGEIIEDNLQSESAPRAVFAERCGMYYQNISQIENGKRYPTLDAICNMCLAFDISPMWLLLGHGEMKGIIASPLMQMQSMGKRLKEIEQIIGKHEKPLRKKAS